MRGLRLQLFVKMELLLRWVEVLVGQPQVVLGLEALVHGQIQPMSQQLHIHQMQVKMVRLHDINYNRKFCL